MKGNGATYSAVFQRASTSVQRVYYLYVMTIGVTRESTEGAVSLRWEIEDGGGSCSRREAN
jgi:hypothetical protein